MNTRQQGFTLLEVILAVVVLATALGLLLGMLSRGVKQVSQAQAESEAAMHAQSLLDMVGTLEPIEAGASEGRFADSRYRWRMQVVPAADPAPPPAPQEGSPEQQAMPTDSAPILYRVVLDVEWGDAGPGQKLHVETLRLRAQPEGGEQPTDETDVAADEAAAQRGQAR